MKPRINLTDREQEVMRWVRLGKKNQEIGSILGIATGTVNKHVERSFRKLGVGNRTAASLLFAELVCPSTPPQPIPTRDPAQWQR